MENIYLLLLTKHEEPLSVLATLSSHYKPFEPDPDYLSLEFIQKESINDENYSFIIEDRIIKILEEDKIMGRAKPKLVSTKMYETKNYIPDVTEKLAEKYEGHSSLDRVYFRTKMLDTVILDIFTKKCRLI